MIKIGVTSTIFWTYRAKFVFTIVGNFSVVPSRPELWDFLSSGPRSDL